jgi:hypothetical protein
MKADRGAADDDFAPNVRAEGKLTSEEITVKADGAIHIGGPEDVFDFEGSHWRSMSIRAGRRFLNGMRGRFHNEKEKRRSGIPKNSKSASNASIQASSGDGA